MKHKIGDVVLVPMRIDSAFQDPIDDYCWMEVSPRPKTRRMVGVLALPIAFLDTCSAAPHVPKVGDTVRAGPLSQPLLVEAIHGDQAVVSWHEASGRLSARTEPLAVLIVPPPERG